MDSGALLASLEGHFMGVTCLLACEGALFSGSADRTIRLWNYTNTTFLASLDARTGISCLLDAGPVLFSGLARGFPLHFPPPDPRALKAAAAFASAAQRQREELQEMEDQDAEVS